MTCSQPEHIVGVSETAYVLTTARCLDWRHEENTTTAGRPCHGGPAQRGLFERSSPRHYTHQWWHSVEILKVTNLSKVYGKGDTQIKALDNVSFGVDKGEFVAIVGPSGSGKSTLLHILGGVDTPSSGQVLVDGTDICALDQTKLAIFRRRQIGLIYQFYNLIPILNVDENITLPLLLDGRSLDEARLKELVTTLGLADRVGHLPNQLSGGQQQRVSIGRALINNPALVLADEPTGNLDSANSKEIISLLKLSNQRYHQTLIVVTHDRDIARQADRIISFGDGRIVRDEAVRA
jgi:putative ABC transport system ATP-binding protein